jgi:hypothetical protein
MMKDDAVPSPSVFLVVSCVPYVVGITLIYCLHCYAFHVAGVSALLASLLLNASMLLLASLAVAGFHAAVAGIPLVTHP